MKTEICKKAREDKNTRPLLLYKNLLMRYSDVTLPIDWQKKMLKKIKNERQRNSDGCMKTSTPSHLRSQAKKCFNKQSDRKNSRINLSATPKASTGKEIAINRDNAGNCDDDISTTITLQESQKVRELLKRSVSYNASERKQEKAVNVDMNSNKINESIQNTNGNSDDTSSKSIIPALKVVDIRKITESSKQNQMLDAPSKHYVIKLKKKHKKFGFNICKHNDICLVDTLVEGTKAAEDGGLILGDKILMINNVKTANMDLQEIENMLQSKSVRTLELEIIRN